MKECIVQYVKYGGVLLERATLGHYILERLRPDQKLKISDNSQNCNQSNQALSPIFLKKPTPYQLLPVT
jgi:hypothetical protein